MARRMTVKKEKIFGFDVMSIKAKGPGGNDFLPLILKVNKLPIDHIQKTIGSITYFNAPDPDDPLVEIGKKIFMGEYVEATESQKDFIIQNIEGAFKDYSWTVMEGIKQAFKLKTESN